MIVQRSKNFSIAIFSGIKCQTLPNGTLGFTHPYMMVLVAYSLQMRIFGKVNGQLLHALWWLYSLILYMHTPLHLGQAKVWTEGDLDVLHIELLHINTTFIDLEYISRSQQCQTVFTEIFLNLSNVQDCSVLHVDHIPLLPSFLTFACIQGK